MVKDYYPISIEKLHNEIKEEEKVKYMIHNNFCLYKYTKGKNKNKLCLNRFKDINDLQYCFMHRWEMRSWVECKSLGCNGKTKIDICRNCKKIYNTKLPDITNDEIISLSNEYVHKDIKQIIIPNALYFIKYKNNTINITYIKSIIYKKYIIKSIKDNEYCMYLNKRKIRKIFKNLINLEIMKTKRLHSLEFISNIPLPPITNDEEILLSLDLNVINNYEINKNDKIMSNLLNSNENKLKKIKDSNSKSLELISLPSFTDINNLNIKKDNSTQTDSITSQESQKTQKCNLCSKYNMLINNLYNINKNIGKEILLIQPHIGNVILDHNILSKALDKKKSNNIEKVYFNTKKLFNYIEGIKIHIIDINMNNLDRLTPKIFNKHKKFLEIFINNIQNLLKKEKFLQNNCNNLLTNLLPIPNPLT